MLETDEVDKDYFTPAASTSLANIFVNSAETEEKSANKSLKYLPPKPEVQKAVSNDDKLGLVPVFNCSLMGHQWFNKVYSLKGNIGCSILKVTKDPIREGALVMVLYNSNKQTLSSISLTPKLQVTVKDLDFVSFYESHESFWCLYGSHNDIKQILDYCKSKNVQIMLSKEQVTSPLETYNKCKNDKSDIESEIGTDESDSAKTKHSILSRMANMGKAVLPKLASNNISTSSSSDEDNKVRKRNESVKVAAKKNTVEQIKIKSNLSKLETAANMVQSKDESNHRSSELMSLQNFNVLTDTVSSNSIDLFFTEQRINNSELRININRVGDKVEKLLTKINNMDNQSKYEGPNINTDILHKLLKEYESKIKMYEELLNDKPNVNKSLSEKSPYYIDTSKEKNLMQDKIIQLETLTKQKDIEISMLSNKIENFNTHSINLQFLSQEKDQLLEKNVELEQQLQSKNELIATLIKQNEKPNSSNKTDVISGQIKSIMNDTFHGIVANFNEGEKYSGEEIRHIVEKVIKNVTILSLK